ncbi:hypothetical protein M5K25_025262 [Dendrobium thyrsiflorum]|uniref:Uncharacterized protein n=1 Tax=Dendrobium thyrsiflorum TaxID=117978 RepID=A0ABD0U419_DENTH
MGEKVVVGAVDGMAEETQCRDHPDRTNPSGICPSCLQEKLRKLISSSKSSNPLFYKPPLSSSSSPPSFPSFKTAIPASRKKSFWSFLTPSSFGKRRSIEYRSDKEDDEVSASYDRKLSRSRSVGCGSRSFSADFLQRISNGLGDCALRRTESHREAKAKLSCDKNGEQRRIKERVKCGGMFGGLGVIPSTSYWFSAAEDSGDFEEFGGLQAVKRGGRSKSWGWVFASPVRAFKAAAGGLPAISPGGGRSGDANRSIVGL